MYRPLVRVSARQLASAARPIAVRGYADHATPQKFNWEDPLNVRSLLTEEEIAISETAEAYCQERVLPRVLRTIPFLLSFNPNPRGEACANLITCFVG